MAEEHGQLGMHCIVSCVAERSGCWCLTQFPFCSCYLVRILAHGMVPLHSGWVFPSYLNLSGNILSPRRSQIQLERQRRTIAPSVIKFTTDYVTGATGSGKKVQAINFDVSIADWWIQHRSGLANLSVCLSVYLIRPDPSFTKLLTMTFDRLSNHNQWA